MHWLRLLRWQNLLIVFATQLLAWLLVIRPVQEYDPASFALSNVNFFLLALSTVCIAGAGYIINDYFDIKIDIINRPEKVVLEKRIPLKQAIIMHSILNAAGLTLALMVARRAGHISYISMQLVCTVMLWFYSTHFKRQFITGNIVVALLTAFTILVLIVYEPALHPYFSIRPFITTFKGVLPNPVYVLGFYIYFAFMLTWMREIVKDMEDFKGDAEQGCVTMPIKWGLKRSEQFTQLLGLLAVLPLLNAGIKLWLSGWKLFGVYTLAALVLPLLFWLITLRSGQATQARYNRYSRWLKGIMVMGILSLVIYYFEAHA
jgi:4-hydroxybenzoate polyprenyltransferase